MNRGTVEFLDRSELQAVIGHEFSHILNDDVKLNLQTTAAIGGLMIIANIGQFLMRGEGDYDRRNSKNNLFIKILGFIVFSIGSLGVFFSRIIQSIISQQREYLADSASVQFTRNPEAMTRALAKIGYIEGSLVENSHNYEMDHMFFCSAIGENIWSRFISTHSSIEERIKKINPGFNVKDFFDSLSTDKQFQNYQKLLDNHKDHYSKKSFSSNKSLEVSLIKVNEDTAKNIFDQNPSIELGIPIESDLEIKNRIKTISDTNDYLEKNSQLYANNLDFTKNQISALPLEISEGLRDVKKAKIIVLFVIYYFQPILVQEKILTELFKQNTEDRHWAEIIIQFLKSNTVQPMILFTLGLKTLQEMEREEKLVFINQIKIIFNSDHLFSFFEMLSLLLIEKYFEISNEHNRIKSYRIINIKLEIESFVYWLLKSSLPETILDYQNRIRKKFYSITSNLLPTSNEWGQQLPLEYDRLKRVLFKLDQLTSKEKKKFHHILFATFTEKDFATKENFEKIRILCALLKVPLPPILLSV